jgi:hypothetical protein
MMHKAQRALALALLAAAPAWAQPAAELPAPAAPFASPAERQAERDRIQHERRTSTTARKREEAACYRRFAVEDCLRDVRAKARVTELNLRAREVRVNDAERRAKAAERLRSIEEKQRVAPDRSQPQGSARGSNRAALPLGSEALQSQHDLEARRRAREQRNRQQSHAADQAERARDNAERAATARLRHEENLKSAQERRERVEKMQSQAAASGRPPAAPLPASSGLNPASKP